MTSPLHSVECAALPEFGERVLRRSSACTPDELFSKLFGDLEAHVHYFEPAFRFVRAALGRGEPPVIEAADPCSYLDQLLRWGEARLSASAPREGGADWALHVVREFAPVGLSDGAWLRGSVHANAVESEVNMSLLRQLMLRFGDPATGEGYAARYAALLRSLGISAAEIAGAEGSARCSAAAYEHALLGLSLGLFPTAFGLETLGFNLWMAALGPAPALARLPAVLRGRGACWRYLEHYAARELLALARGAIECAWRGAGEPRLRERVARGFAAAQSSYETWEQGLRMGKPAALVGEYAPPQDPESLEQFALERYGELSHPDLYYCFANADCHPASQIFARRFVAEVFGKLEQAMAEDARLNSQHPPAYSERTVAELVLAQHVKNVRSRAAAAPSRSASPASDAPLEDPEHPEDPSIVQVFDGSWLQGFADVQRADFEEYGWLFRIYASEHGDGDWAYNHCQIFRRAFFQLGPAVMLPKTDRRLYDLFEIGVAALATLAVALNTRHFLPEILGINLGIEATGVGGSYMDQWKGARGPGARWRALAWRLHNSIDNYADGHTKWSLAAVQSFLRRVKEAAPSEVEVQWHKIWRLWRCQDILTHGSESERAALAEHLELTSLAPTPV